jgi:amino-acid N-acetyltransferase
MGEASLGLHRADAGSIGYVERLLEAADLPTADVREKPDRFYIAERGGERIGAGGVEVVGDVGLLRSVVIEPAERGLSLGTALCDALEAEATDAGVDELYLLTETAAGFFADRGYREIDRADAPVEIQRTTKFAELCPDSAVCMRKPL